MGAMRGLFVLFPLIVLESDTNRGKLSTHVSTNAQKITFNKRNAFRAMQLSE